MENLRKSGILLHPTSLPSQYGIGDLGRECYDFIDFLHQSGQSIWQVLPLGPTGFKDSPYQSYSAFAGNYYLISPDILLKDSLLTPNDIENKPDFSPDNVEYGKVIDYKMSLFKKAFNRFSKISALNKDYARFKRNNAFWLDSCCLFAAIKDYYIEKRKNEFESEDLKKFRSLTKDFLSENVQNDYYYGAVWVTWEKDIVNRSKSAIEKYTQMLKDKIEFYAFLQYTFFRQWQSVKQYAHKYNISIIGDIPIFVAWDSADVWENKELFYLDSNGFPKECAGVPPDYFSPTGQLWGNPLYNWDKHKKTGYQWWINRIKNCLKLTDVIRIDHFRGFESYYAIPFGMPDATIGQWVKGPGEDFFNAVKKELGSCPFIAEDLGIITDEVVALRLKTGLPGMKILQFAFDDSENNDYLPHNYEKNCVVYTGTHDNDTSRGWYENTSDFCRDYLRRYMNTDGNNPAWDLIRLAFSSCANTAVFPLQDVLSLPSYARMNTPGTENDNWTWRFKSNDLTDEYALTLKYFNRIFKRNMPDKKAD